MSFLIEDKFNTIENIEKNLEDKGLLDKIKELYSRGIKLTPIQANMLLLDYPNFGGRAYGKSYMNMINRFSKENIQRKVGEFFTFYFNHTNEWGRILDFQREYYPEFEIIKKHNNSLIFKKVR